MVVVVVVLEGVGEEKVVEWLAGSLECGRVSAILHIKQKKGVTIN
jgi:hypothetical protein